MARRQVRSSIRLESVIISLIGTLIGLVIGLVFGWALVRALRDDGITAFAVPWLQLAAIVVLAAVAGVGAALTRRGGPLDSTSWPPSPPSESGDPWPTTHSRSPRRSTIS